MVLQEYSELLCTQDKFWQERLTLAIGLQRESTGLLHMALNEQTKPLRRYFAVRMLLCMASEFPEVLLLLLLCADAGLCLDSSLKHGHCQSPVRHVHCLNRTSARKTGAAASAHCPVLRQHHARMPGYHTSKRHSFVPLAKAAEGRHPLKH